MGHQVNLAASLIMSHWLDKKKSNVKWCVFVSKTRPTTANFCVLNSPPVHCCATPFHAMKLVCGRDGWGVVIWLLHLQEQRIWFCYKRGKLPKGASPIWVSPTGPKWTNPDFLTIHHTTCGTCASEHKNNTKHRVKTNYLPCYNMHNLGR